MVRYACLTGDREIAGSSQLPLAALVTPTESETTTVEHYAKRLTV